MRDKRTLLSDERGAILVMAVFMAAFMVGCLWYIIGIGDAAIYRQKMQDGADASAYVSAVYHARGMNIIAIMNLIMAAVLAVLIALKVAQIISGIVAVVAGIICLIPFGQWACPIEAGALDVFETLTANIIPKAQKVVDRVLQALSFAQKGVAITAPWIGSVQSFQHAKNYSPSVSKGLAVSISMVPSELLKQDKRIGLPVQEMGFEKLCEKAGKLGADLVGFWLPSTFRKVFSGAVGNITGTFSAFFCGGGTSTAISGAVDANDACANSKQEADQKQKEFEQQKAEAEKNGTPPPSPPGKFDPKKCKEEVDKGKGKDKTKEDPTAKDKQKTDNRTAKEMYFRSQNGDDYFAVYSFVTGETTEMKRSEKGVKIPSWNSAPAEGGVLDDIIDVAEEVGFARADFYYDQTAGDGALDWSSYKSEALWHIQWRARLRRFRLPTPDIGSGFIQNGTTKIPGIPAKFKIGGMDALGKKITKVVGGNKYIGGLIKKEADSKAGTSDAGNGFDALVDQFVGGATDGFIVH